jgi:Lon protease-like protein
MIVPIFPLPNVVLFPKTLLPLHIFEQRYRAMTREAIAGDRTIAIVLLKEGWEGDTKHNPPVHEIACLGKIETYEELEEGKYNIILTGLRRVRLVRELEHAPYRLAEIEFLEDQSPDDAEDNVVGRRNHMAGLFARYTELATAGKHRAVELMPQLDFEALVNLVASTINLPAEEKQSLLEMDNPMDRCDVLIPILQIQIEALVLVRAYEHLKPEEPRWN